MSSLRSLARGLAVTVPIAVIVVGCGPGGPTPHEVKGKVVYKGKGNIGDLANGIVHFQSTTDPGTDLTVMGSIEDDGSFTLGSFYKDRELPGVPSGTYKARVEPPFDDSVEEEEARLPIHRKYLDFDKSGLTFTVPVSEEIVIEVQRR